MSNAELRQRGATSRRAPQKSFRIKLDSSNNLWCGEAAFALDAAGVPLDEDAFEKLMEIKRGDDHRKFVEMVKAVDNPGLDFNSQVFNKYFNQDNYDTNFHNFYLYNPKDTEKFYYLFVAKIGDPMPFTLDDPELIKNDSYNFSLLVKISFGM